MDSVPSVLNNLKTKVDKLDVGRLKHVSVDLRKYSAVVNEAFLTNIKCNKLNTEVNNLENKIPDATTLNQINQYNKDK